MNHIISYKLFEQLKPPVKPISGDEVVVKKPIPKKVIKQPKTIVSSGYEFDLVTNSKDKFEVQPNNIYKCIAKFNGKGGYDKYVQKCEPKNYSKLQTQLEKAVEYYEKWLSDPDTKKKLKNKDSIVNIQTVPSLLNLKVLTLDGIINDIEGAQAFVYTDDDNGQIYWNNVNTLGDLSDEFIRSTLIHEIGHLIDHKLRKLGEKSIYDKNHKCKGVVSRSSKPKKEKAKGSLWADKDYLESPTEIYARLQQTRDFLGLKPIETPQSFIDKFLNALKTNKLKFHYQTHPYHDKETETTSEAVPHQYLTVIDNKTKLCFTPNTKIDKSKFSDEYISWFIENSPQYTPQTPIEEMVKYIGLDRFSISALFINFSEVKNGKLIVDIQKLCDTNNELVKTQDQSDVARRTA